MKVLRKLGRGAVDLLEVYFPVGVFVGLFIVFLVNIVFRYIVRSPQNWTYEVSINAFVIVGLLGACAAYRREDHVVFDLLYARLKPRSQAVMRMISSILQIGFFAAALPGTVRYVWKFPAVTSILSIPERYIFVTLPILLLSTIFRSAWRLALDVRAFRAGTYAQTYNTAEKGGLI